MKKNKIGGFFGILLVVLLGFGLFAGVHFGAAEISRVLLVGDRAVKVTATITGYDIRTEVDEGYEETYYEHKISYDYNGQHYSGISYGSSGKKPELGKELTITVDPENPGDPLDPDYGFAFVLSPIFLAILAGVGYAALKAALCDRVKPDEALLQNTEDKAAYDKKCGRIAKAIVAAVLLLVGLLYRAIQSTWVMLGFCAVAFVLVLIVEFISLHKKKKA